MKNEEILNPDCITCYCIERISDNIILIDSFKKKKQDCIKQFVKLINDKEETSYNWASLRKEYQVLKVELSVHVIMN